MNDPIAIQVEHRFQASAERVYDAWLDPERASKFFFATATGHVVRCEIDARVGGKFVIVDRRDGDDVEHAGTFLELERPRRIAFEYGVAKYGSDASRVVIDITPEGEGCRLVLTHTLDRRYAGYAARTKDGWAKILEVLSLLEPGEASTCGRGLAAHSPIPAKIAELFAGLAETLELHRAMIVQGSEESKREDEVYRALAASYRDLAESTARAAERMAAQRELPMAPHDENAFGPAQLRAFEKFVEAESALLAALEIAASHDQKMLREMTGG